MSIFVVNMVKLKNIFSILLMLLMLQAIADESINEILHISFLALPCHADNSSQVIDHAQYAGHFFIQSCGSSGKQHLNSYSKILYPDDFSIVTYFFATIWIPPKITLT